MISQIQILRLADTQQYGRLVQRILQNGRPCTNGIRRRLMCPEIARIAALSLGIQRFLELNYGRSSEGDRLLKKLLQLQDSSTGLFGGPEASDDDRLVATALGIRALLDYIAVSELPAEPRVVDMPVVFAAQTALSHAAEALLNRMAGLAMLGGNTETASIIQWQLSDAQSPNTALPGRLLDGIAQMNKKHTHDEAHLATAA